MADDTLNYRVNIDTSSLASQLAQVKNTIDSAVATYTFNATLPGPLAPGLLGNAMRNTGIAMSQGADMAQGQASQFMDSSRLGFQKFAYDVQNTMLTTHMGLSPVPWDMGGINDATRGFGPGRAAFEGLTGFSYNPRMGMTYGRYQERAFERLSDLTPSIIGMGVDTLAGAGVTSAGVAGMLGLTGSAGVIAGTAGAALIPMVLGGAVMSTFGHDVNAAFRARGFARDTSWRFASGRFSNEQAGAIGLDIAGLGRDPGNIGLGISQNDAMSMVQQFTNIGGFDSIRTAEEFRDRARGLVNNVRKLVEITGATEKEIMSTLKSLQDSGVLGNNMGGAASIGLGVTAQAYRAGYTFSEFNALGTQGMEMMRGTGIMSAAGYFGIQHSMADVRDQVRNGTMNPELLWQLGGEANLAASRERIGTTFGMSDEGLIFFAAGGPGRAGTTLQQQYAQGLRNLSRGGVRGLLRWQGAQADLVSAMGPAALYDENVIQHIEKTALSPLFGPGGPDEQEWIGYLMNNVPGMTAPQAKDEYSRIRAYQGGAPMRAIGAASSEFNVQTYRGAPDPFVVAKNVIAADVANALGVRFFGEQIINAGTTIDRGTRNLSRAYHSGILTATVIESAFSGLGLRGWGEGIGQVVRGMGVDITEKSPLFLAPGADALPYAGMSTQNMEMDLQKRIDQINDNIAQTPGGYQPDYRSDRAKTTALPPTGHEENIPELVAVAELNQYGPAETLVRQRARLKGGNPRMSDAELDSLANSYLKTTTEYAKAVNPALPTLALARGFQDLASLSTTAALIQAVTGKDLDVKTMDDMKKVREAYTGLTDAQRQGILPSLAQMAVTTTNSQVISELQKNDILNTTRVSNEFAALTSRWGLGSTMTAADVSAASARMSVDKLEGILQVLVNATVEGGRGLYVRPVKGQW